MSSLCAYRQLGLIDADDGRLRLFKDHQKYISHMAPNCEWCLFWNGLRLPVYKNFRSATRPYSRIHLRPSYYQRPKNSLNPDLLDSTKTSVPTLAFVLLVQGDQQPYSEIVQLLQRHYAKEKLEVQELTSAWYNIYHLYALFSQAETMRIVLARLWQMSHATIIWNSNKCLVLSVVNGLTALPLFPMVSGKEEPALRDLKHSRTRKIPYTPQNQDSKATRTLPQDLES